MRAGKGAVFIGAAKWLDVVATMVTLLFTARLISPEAFGIYGMALLAVLIPETVLGGALAESLIQRKDLRSGHLNGAFALHVVLFVLLIGGLFLLSPLVAAHFSEPQLAVIVPVIAGTILVSCIGAVPGAILQRELRFGAIAFGDAAGTIAAAALGIGLAFAGFGVWSLVFMEMGRRVAKQACFIVAAKWFPTFKFKFDDIRELLRFNLLTLATRLLLQFDQAIPSFFVGSILGAQALGYFNMAFRILQQISAVMMAPFASVALPVASAVQHDRQRMHVFLGAATRAAALLAFPVFVGASAVAPVALPLLLGQEWAPVGLAAQILILTAIRSPANVFNGEVLRGIGKPGLQVATVLSGTALALVLVPIATTYGIAWTCVAVLLRGLLQWVVAAIVVERTIGYPAQRQFLVGWESMVASAVMGVAVVAVTPLAAPHLQSGVLFGVLVLLGAIVHLSLLFILAPKLLRKLVDLAVALARRDRNGVARVLGLT
jgi:O-antigen/teichoic acid export membrane protein